MKNRTVAILLALFLGGFGAHKFYLNQPGWGVLYLVFCWTFIPSIISVFEIIMFLVVGEDGFNAKFNKQYVEKQYVANVNVPDELEKLYELKEKGIITSEEFEQRKKRIL